MLLVLLLLLLCPSLQWISLTKPLSPKLFSQMQSYTTSNTQSSPDYSGAYQVEWTSSPCSDHSCRQSRNANGEYIRDGEDMAVQFGGAQPQSDPGDSSFSNQLVFYNIQQNTTTPWQNLYSDPEPSPRLGHSSLLVSLTTDCLRKYLFIYGGIGSSGVLNDFWQFEVAYMPLNSYPSSSSVSRWVQLASGVPSRAFANMFSYVSVLYIYAGIDHDQTPTNSIYGYDLSTHTWLPQPITYYGISQVKRTTRTWDGSVIVKQSAHPETVISPAFISYASHTTPSDSALNIPSARYMAASTQSSSTLYFLGGLSPQHKPLDDFWSLELSNFTFTQIFHTVSPSQLHRHRPPALYGAQMQLFPQDNIIFLIGGVDDNGLTTEFWEYRTQQNHWLSIPQSHFYTQLTPPSTVGHQLFPYAKGILLLSSFAQSTPTTPESDLSSSPKYSLGRLSLYLQSTRLLFYFSNNQVTLPSSSSTLLLFSRDEHCNPSFRSNGYCFWGRLECKPAFIGQHCDQKQCPNSFCYYDPFSLAAAHCFFCSKHGTCQQGQCVCKDGYSSPENGCQMSGCQKDCSRANAPDAGQCVPDFPQSQCDCNQAQKRGGDDCSKIFCLNDCTNNGECIDGVCAKCAPNYAGEDCSVYIIDINI